MFWSKLLSSSPGNIDKTNTETKASFTQRAIFGTAQEKIARMNFWLPHSKSNFIGTTPKIGRSVNGGYVHTEWVRAGLRLYTRQTDEFEHGPEFVWSLNVQMTDHSSVYPPYQQVFESFSTASHTKHNK